MDDKVGLVFSWDPRSKVWVKERGPEDGQAPPVAPIDDGAVQTYFLDPANGKWNGTILGLKARQISVELKDKYRAPYVPGLALPRTKEAEAPAPRRSRAPVLAGIVALLVLVAGGAFVAQAMLQPGGTALKTSPPVVAATPTPSATPAATEAPSPSATATSAPTTASGGGGRADPTPRPPTSTPAPATIRLSVRLPDGTTVVYSGPPAVAQGTILNGIFSAVLANGQGGNFNMTVFLGDPANSAANQSVSVRPDPNGNYLVAIRAAVPKGDQRLSVIYGNNAGFFSLGTIAVR